MGIPHYLAMTPAELSTFPPPEKAAWMSCHFSPCHSGLSNLPSDLPPGSLLILDDSTPMEHHDPKIIIQQLLQWLERVPCDGILLDFQRSGSAQAQDLAVLLSAELPCPVPVSHLYAKALDCPVFLPPLPLHSRLDGHLLSWKGRDIWLETALDREVLTLTEDGCKSENTPQAKEDGFVDKKLHCHYQAELLENAARFTLWRTREDLEALLAEAESLGVKAAVGLWQEYQA